MGSEGDIRPFIALARELKANNHEVSIATSQNYQELIRSFGIDHIGLNSYGGRKPTRFEPRIVTTIRSTITTRKEYLTELWNVCQNVDILIYNVVAHPCFYVAEKLGIPAIAAFVQPHHPTRAFPDPSIATGKSLGGGVNLAGYWIFGVLYWQYVRRSINQWRKETLHLPGLSFRESILRQMRRKRTHFLYAYSPAFLPKPPDWPSERLEVSGYWFLDVQKEYEPPADLIHFLNSGPPPVFISTMWNTNKFTRERLLEISNLLENRVIVHDLYFELNGLTSTEKLFYINGSLPHEWLFKRISVAVHHGGLGICLNCIRAGVPMITMPADSSGNDHKFWASQVSRAGVGIRLSISEKDKRFSKKLLSSIKTVLNDNDIKIRTVAMGKRISEENGLQNAMKFISLAINDQ
jgi:UDP:flavonoid glycosyltransferase YjiC (YdhE family)